MGMPGNGNGNALFRLNDGNRLIVALWSHPSPNRWCWLYKANNDCEQSQPLFLRNGSRRNELIRLFIGSAHVCWLETDDTAAHPSCINNGPIAIVKSLTDRSSLMHVNGNGLQSIGKIVHDRNSPGFADRARAVERRGGDTLAEWRSLGAAFWFAVVVVADGRSQRQPIVIRHLERKQKSTRNKTTLLIIEATESSTKN